jgi:hypothetical protein
MLRVTGRPELPEVQAFARLVRLGQVPTRGAVQGEMVSLAGARRPAPGAQSGSSKLRGKVDTIFVL